MLKKAVSPLIATVLLVAFAVALGAIIINYTSNTTNTFKDKTDELITHSISCSIDTSIDLVSVDNEDIICYNRSGTDNLEFVLDNTGEQDIDGVQVFILDYLNNPYTANSLTPINKHERAKFNISLKSPPLAFNVTFPPIKITLTPITQYKGQTADICTDKAISIEEVETC